MASKYVSFCVSRIVHTYQSGPKSDVLFFNCPEVSDHKVHEREQNGRGEWFGNHDSANDAQRPRDCGRRALWMLRFHPG